MCNVSRELFADDIWTIHVKRIWRPLGGRMHVHVHVQIHVHIHVHVHVHVQIPVHMHVHVQVHVHIHVHMDVQVHVHICARASARDRGRNESTHLLGVEELWSGCLKHKQLVSITNLRALNFRCRPNLSR